MPEIFYPAFSRYQVRVFCGGCVKRGDGSSFRAKAHAHNNKKDRFFGWICVRSRKRLFAESGAPSDTMWHELAHILTPGHAHDDSWRKMMIRLGQSLPSQYAKIPRKLCGLCKRKVKNLTRHFIKDSRRLLCCDGTGIREAGVLETRGRFFVR